MVKKKSSKKDYLTPEEASEIVENGEPYKVPKENGNGGHLDKVWCTLFVSYGTSFLRFGDIYSRR
jgi:hypothetical protein